MANLKQGFVPHENWAMVGDMTITGDLTVTNDFTFGDAVTDALSVNGLYKQGTNASPLTLTAGTPLFSLYSTNAGTSGSTNAEPFYLKSVLTGAGQVGGRAYFLVTSNVASGPWINAIKGDVEFGSSGSTSGLASAVVAEMTLPSQTVPSGQYYPLEIEWIGGASTSTAGTTGSGTGAIYINATGTVTDFDTHAGLFWLNGVTSGTGKIYYGNTIKTYVTSSMTTKYLVLSGTENSLDLGAATTPIDLSGAFTTGIQIDADGTTALSVTSNFTGANVISIAGTASTAGINVSGACVTVLDVSGAFTTGININADGTTGIAITSAFSGTTGISFAGTATDGLAITGACGDAVHISGTNTSTALHISGDQVVGILYDVDAAADTGISFAVDNGITLGSGISMVCTGTGTITNAISVTYTASATEMIAGTVANGQTITTGMSMSGAGTWTTGILLDATAIGTGISISAGSLTDGIKISGTTPVDGLEISSACSANAINLSGGSATAINIAAPTTTGILFAGGASYNPIHIGVKSNDADAGLILTGVTDDTGGVMIFCDDGGDALASVTSPIWTRYLVTTSQSGGATATGLYAQLKNKAATFNTGSYTALKAFYQCGGATTLQGSAELAIINAGISFEGNLTNTLGTLSGVDVNINDGAYTIGTHYGIIIRKTGSSTLGWTTGLYIPTGGAVTGIQIGDATTGINLTGAYTNAVYIDATGGATARAVNINMDPATANYGDGYAMSEFNLNPTGNGAGHMAALGAWVNVTAGTQGGGGAYVAAQSNGVYEASGADVTEAKVIFGMRAQYQGDEQPAKLNVWSIHSPGKPITALYDVSSFHTDIGYEAGTGATGSCTGYIRFMNDAGGNVKYIRLYDGTS